MLRYTLWHLLLNHLIGRKKLSTEWTVQCLGNTEKKIRRNVLLVGKNLINNINNNK
jgi:CRISPR/Cas system-associated protein endoribonuclease Cas2